MTSPRSTTTAVGAMFGWDERLPLCPARERGGE